MSVFTFVDCLSCSSWSFPGSWYDEWFSVESWTFGYYKTQMLFKSCVSSGLLRHHTDGWVWCYLITPRGWWKSRLSPQLPLTCKAGGAPCYSWEGIGVLAPHSASSDTPRPRMLHVAVWQRRPCAPHSVLADGGRSGASVFSVRCLG